MRAKANSRDPARIVVMDIAFRFGSRSAWRIQLAITAALALGHVVSMVVPYLGHDYTLLRLLDLNEERSAGTFYSVVGLLACAVVLLVLAFAARRRDSRWRGDALWWLGLSGLFVFMSADEGLALHEVLMLPVRKALHASGVLYYAWIIPYSGLVLMIVLLYARFLLRLPRVIAIRFVLAGAVYVGGAVGLEMAAGYMVETRGYGERSLPMEIEYLVEETLEMLGAGYFLTALLRYIELGGQPLQLTVTMPESTGSRHGDP
jgi:hypothetical protein